MSGPGALSRRTDGAAPTQPIREQPASFYGERKALVDQQRAAPLSAGAPAHPAPAGGEPPRGGMVPAPGTTEGVFGPSTRPGEPVTAGAAAGPGPTIRDNSFLFEQDPDMVLRQMYAVYPHPSILRLLKNREPT